MSYDDERKGRVERARGREEQRLPPQTRSHVTALGTTSWRQGYANDPGGFVATKKTDYPGSTTGPGPYAAMIPQMGPNGSRAAQQVMEGQSVTVPLTSDQQRAASTFVGAQRQSERHRDGAAPKLTRAALRAHNAQYASGITPTPLEQLQPMFQPGSQATPTNPAGAHAWKDTHLTDPMRTTVDHMSISSRGSRGSDD